MMFGRRPSFMHPMGFMVSEFAMAQMMGMVPPEGTEAEFRQLRLYVATQIATANPDRDPRGIAIYADELVEQVERQIKARKARKYAEQKARGNFKERAHKLAHDDPEVVRLRAEREHQTARCTELEGMRPKGAKKKRTPEEVALDQSIDKDKTLAYQAAQKAEGERRLLQDQLESDHYHRLCNQAGILPQENP